MRDPPSGKVQEQGPDWFLVATEACGGGTSDLGYFLGVYVFIGIFGIGFTSGGSPSRPRDRGPCPGGRVRPHPRGQPGTLLAQLFYSGGFFWSIKNHQKLARQLDSVWHSFSIKLKNKEKQKQKLALGSRVIG